MLNEFKKETLEEQAPAIEYDYFKGRTAWNEYEDNLPSDYDSIQLAERARIRKEYLEKKAKENEKKRKKLERKRVVRVSSDHVRGLSFDKVLHLFNRPCPPN